MPGWTRASVMKVAAAILLIHLALVLPDRLQDLRWTSFLLLPIELPFVIALLCLPLGRFASVVRGLVVFALTLLVALKLAAVASYIALARPFDLMLDLYLLEAGWRLLSGSVGVLSAFLAVGGAVAAVALMAVLLAWATKAIVAAAAARRGPLIRVAAGGLALGLFGLTSGAPVVAIISSEVVAGQVARTIESAADLAAMRATAAGPFTVSVRG